MSQEYYEAAVPEPWTILGLNLKPFSAGHLILLHRVESAFVLGGPITWEDLALSVFICSQSFEDACESFNDPELNKFMLEWYEALTANDQKIDLAEKSEMFGQYLNAGSRCPDHTYKEGGSSIGEVPTVQFVKAYLMLKTNMSESEFLNRPWTRSLWDFITIQALEGQVQLFKEGTIADAQAVAAKLHAKLVAEGTIK